MLVIGQCNRKLKGQLTRNVCVNGQNASRARTVVSYFAELTIALFCFHCFFGFCLLLLGFSKGNARVEIRASFFFFVRLQIAVNSSSRMRGVLTVTHTPRFD